ncbi:MAG: RNase adapter RapZ [Gammaproteobacteria bacterium]|nr:RNase adapter RapZ [Gammaproteobacteria bacterium]
MKLIVISGLSGAGKSIALQVLEDQGYYCVDNLPLALLAQFAEQMARMTGGQDGGGFAVGIDARNFLGDLPRISAILQQVARHGIPYETVFLEASNEVLIKRFSETRRRHPLARGGVPLVEAIIQERELLAPVADVADLRLETSHLNVHQLRGLINSRVIGKQQNLSLQFMSFGFKKGVPADADFVFDVRCLPNPYWDPELRVYTGKDPQVIHFLQREDMVAEMVADLRQYLQRWLERIASGGRSYLTVAVGCTGGRHRSVYIVERLAEQFASQYQDLVIRHRELS